MTGGILAFGLPSLVQRSYIGKVSPSVRIVAASPRENSYNRERANQRIKVGYSPERRESVLRKLLPPNSIAIAELAKAEGISEATLYIWRKQARNEGRLMPDSDNTSNGWSSRDKFAAVMESAAMSETEKSAYCRERGIYPEQLSQWRVACEQANDWQRSTDQTLKATTKTDRKKINRLEKELARKEKALAEAAALLVLRKKYEGLFQDNEDEK